MRMTTTGPSSSRGTPERRGEAGPQRPGDVGALTSTVPEARHRPAGVAVVDLGLHLDHARAGTDRVDRHGDLEPEPLGAVEVAEQLGTDGPLPREGGACLEPAGAPDAACRHVAHLAEPATPRRGREDGDRHVGLVVEHGR